MRYLSKHTRTALTVLGMVLSGEILSGCAGTAERAARDRWDLERTRTVVDADSTAPVLDSDLRTLDAYLAVGLDRNRSVRAARETWGAALERVPQARALPDPLLTYGYYVQSIETRVGAQRQRVGITQGVPWFGTLGVKGDIALSEAEIARRRYQDALQKVVRDITVAFAEYYFLGAALRITQDNIDLLAGWERILRARYTTGGVAYSDLIKVQVELGQLEDRQTTLERQREPHTARLRALLDLDRDIPLPWPESLPSPEPLPPVEDLRAQLAGGNTELKILSATVDREEHRRSLAGKASYPDLALGLDWVQTDPRTVDVEDNGKDALVARVAVRLPLWTGPRAAGRREAEARHRSALLNRQDRENLLYSELDELAFRHEDAERKTALYRDSLIPKGNQSLQAAFAAFESGEGDFLSVLDAERALLEFGLSLERSRADRLRARAHLDVLTGQARTGGGK